MRTSFHHQPEAQHPNFQLSTSWQADYPIFRGKSGRAADITGMTESDPTLPFRDQFCCYAEHRSHPTLW
jgi:hypothetical protein